MTSVEGQWKTCQLNLWSFIKETLLWIIVGEDRNSPGNF